MRSYTLVFLALLSACLGGSSSIKNEVGDVPPTEEMVLKEIQKFNGYSLNYSESPPDISSFCGRKCSNMKDCQDRQYENSARYANATDLCIREYGLWINYYEASYTEALNKHDKALESNQKAVPPSIPPGCEVKYCASSQDCDNKISMYYYNWLSLVGVKKVCGSYVAAWLHYYQQISK